MTVDVKYNEHVEGKTLYCVACIGRGMRGVIPSEDMFRCDAPASDKEKCAEARHRVLLSVANRLSE